MRGNFIFSILLVSFFFFSCKNKSHLNEEVYEDIEAVINNYNLDEAVDYPMIEDYQFEDIEFNNSMNRKSLKHSSREIKSDLIHTKLEVSLNWKKSQLNGKATLTLKPKCYVQDILELDAKGMDILSVTMNNMPCAYTYKDSLKLWINLDRTYTKSEEYTVVIDYTSKPEERETSGSFAITSDKGLYFINPLGDDKNKMPQIWTQGETESSSVWFPTIDAPNVKTTQEIYITVEEKYKTLSNGKLISSKSDKKGNRTDYWKQDLPHAPYLFMIAVGEFEVVKDEYKKSDGSKIQVNYYVEPEFQNDAKAIFGETPEMIKFFSNLLGVEYVWDKYSQIVVRDYVSGAMENTGAVIFGDFVYKNKRELMDENDQSTIAHELFHHWFGDLVTCESWSNLPLNESFANYSQYLWDEHKYGRDEADYNAEIEAQGYYSSTSFGGYHNLIWFDYNDKEDMFDAHSYNKGGRILHMLRKHLGDDAFFKGLNRYLTQNKYKSTEYNHLRLAFEEITGQDLNWFFDQWFLGKGHPVLFVDYKINKAEQNIIVEVKQMQNHEFPIFTIPVEIGVWDAKGYHIEKVILSDEIQEFVLGFSGELKNVIFDADQMILGRVAEDKSAEFYLYQLKSKESRLKARANALKRLKGTQYWEEALLYALNDKHWSIRQEAIQEFNTTLFPFSSETEASLKEKITNLIEIEKKPSVLYELIKISSDKELISDDKLVSIALAKHSYTVQESAFEALSKNNQSKFDEVLDSLIKSDDEKEKLIVCSVLSQSNDDSYFPILESLASENLSSNFEFRSFISFMVYITQAKERGDYYDWNVKLIDLYNKKSANTEGLFKMYNWRIKMFLQEFLQGIIEEINQKIADVDTTNRSELIQQKTQYENLLNSVD